MRAFPDLIAPGVGAALPLWGQERPLRTPAAGASSASRLCPHPAAAKAPAAQPGGAHIPPSPRRDVGLLHPEAALLPRNGSTLRPLPRAATCSVPVWLVSYCLPPPWPRTCLQEPPDQEWEERSRDSLGTGPWVGGLTEVVSKELTASDLIG